METINRVINIGNGSLFRMRCCKINLRSSSWVLEEFVEKGILWWKKKKWVTLILYTNYGWGEVQHDYIYKKQPGDNDETVMYNGEGQLDFLGIEY